uniref:Phytanoyl-CoA hydroxylase-interacting protein-like C-terminal domain-containing protein n=1 Tax=Meloidogyne enterolobii TaxID=390850 RepID=A0A6V7V633_MELEN|nr:unnamed protein product [Meloidogyne enterolobii]
MWPPPRHNMPIPPPPIQPYGMPHHGHPPDPYMDRRVVGGAPPLAGPQWNHREVGTWRVPGEDWRSAGHQQPWSNHDFYQRQYGGNVPIARSFAQFDRRPGSPLIKPPESSSHIDYEKQLREHYETPKPSYSDFSEMTKAAAPQDEKYLELNSVTSARRIHLNWKLPTLPANDKFKINLAIKLEELEGGIGRGARTGELGLILDKVLPIHTTKTYFDAIPGSLYSIDLNVIGQKGNVFTSNSIKERATFSIDEMMVLMQKAIDFTGTSMQSFTFLYRCKPRIYWDYVYEMGQVLNPYLKDSNGQAACPLNQNIEGLFFSAKTNPDGSLPNSSPFGDVRMVLPAHNLLDPQRVNLYFADFYCNRVPHYVTVVVAFKDSDVDKFSKDKLLPLDPFDNQFLLLQHTSNSQSPLNFFVNKKVWVEIYYTETVPMRWGRFDNIIPQGVGTSKIGGLPHNKNCRTCNLYPIGVPAPPLPHNYDLLKKDQADQMVNEAINAKLPDEDDDDIECLDESTSSSRFMSYELLQRRYERLEHAISSDFNNKEITNSEHEIYKNLTSEVYDFLKKMNKDFIILNERIDLLAKSEYFCTTTTNENSCSNDIYKKKAEFNNNNICPISGTLKSVIDIVVSSPERRDDKEEEDKSHHYRHHRTRKLSINSEVKNKKRRTTREDSI